MTSYIVRARRIPLQTVIEDSVTNGRKYGTTSYSKTRADTVFDVQYALLLKEYQQGYVTPKGLEVYSAQLEFVRKGYGNKQLPLDANDIAGLMDAQGMDIKREILEFKRKRASISSNESLGGFSQARDSSGDTKLWVEMSACDAFSNRLSPKDAKDLLESYRDNLTSEHLFGKIRDHLEPEVIDMGEPKEAYGLVAEWMSLFSEEPEDDTDTNKGDDF